jgi:hypothetical protein
VIVGKQRKPPPLTLSPRDWAPLEAAFAQVAVTVGADDLVAHDLTQDLRKGLLVSAWRSRDGNETQSVKPSEWRQWQVCPPYFMPRFSLSEPLQNHGVSVTSVEKNADPVGHFFVRRRELDQRYPATPSAPATTGDHPAYDTPRQKPGKKAKDDWPMLVASKLIYLAFHDSEMLKNIDALVRHMQDFLEAEIGWAPKDPQAIRKKIVFLLRSVRNST